MDKTININIAGSLFKIDEDAFSILRDYLQAISTRFRNVKGGNETIEDIESRISEIFQSQKGLAGAISRENVESMISIIGKPGDFDAGEEEESIPQFPSQRKRMYRNPDDKIIGGVCSGIGAYLDTDPVLFRILFVIFTAFFGIGFFIYLVLWIALPEANNDSKKRELYGNSYQPTFSAGMNPDGSYSSRSSGSAKIGSAINEIFRAVGRILYIILRIFLIIIGISLVITGFLTIVALLMVFVFKLPWTFSNDAFNSTMIWFPEFLNYIVTPAFAPWIIYLLLMAVILPMLAIIYWGVKMIFWFRVKDGILSLVGFILWVMAVTALAIILFNEGISFAESAKTLSQSLLPQPPDTLFVMTDHKVADLKFNKQFAVPDDEYRVFMDDSTKRIYICPDLRLKISGSENAKIEIRKQSSGRTRTEAVKKSESLEYSYRISNDTLYLDEYFTLPEGDKWSADFLTINICLPEQSVLYFDNSTEKMFRNRISVSKTEGNEISYSITDQDTEPWELGNKYWVLTEDGLEEIDNKALLTK